MKQRRIKPGVGCGNRDDDMAVVGPFDRFVLLHGHQYWMVTGQPGPDTGEHVVLEFAWWWSAHQRAATGTVGQLAASTTLGRVDIVRNTHYSTPQEPPTHNRPGQPFIICAIRSGGGIMA